MLLFIWRWKQTNIKAQSRTTKVIRFLFLISQCKLKRKSMQIQVGWEKMWLHPIIKWSHEAKPCMILDLTFCSSLPREILNVACRCFNLSSNCNNRSKVLQSVTNGVSYFSFRVPTLNWHFQKFECRLLFEEHRSEKNLCRLLFEEHQFVQCVMRFDSQQPNIDTFLRTFWSGVVNRCATTVHFFIPTFLMPPSNLYFSGVM